MTWLYRILLFLAILPIQTILLETVRVAGVKPDLPLIFVFLQGWLYGRRAGLCWGLALGGLIDLFSTGLLGASLVLKGVVGFFSGVMGRGFLHLSVPMYAAIFLLVSAAQDVAGNLFVHGIGLEGISALRAGEIAARAVYNALVMVAAVLIMEGRTEQKGVMPYGGVLSPRRKPGAGK